MEIRWNGSLDSQRLRRDDAILGISEGDLKGAEAFFDVILWQTRQIKIYTTLG